MMAAGPTRSTAFSRRPSPPTTTLWPPRRPLPRNRPSQVTPKSSNTKTKKAAGIPKLHAEVTGHELKSKTRSRDARSRHHRGTAMLWLRIFALVLLVAPFTPAFGQRLMSSTEPTVEDVDPG